MRKHQEINDPYSCFNRAYPDEMIFVFLGRDAAAPAAIRFWCEARISSGKNTREDAQIKEALKCADTMDKEGL